MKIMQAEEIKRFSNWTLLIYSEPGKGKTSMIQSLTGRTIVLSVDGMYHVLSGLPNVTIIDMDAKNPSDELGNFYKYLLKNIDNFDNIVIDNMSTFEKFWLNAIGKKTKSGMPELKDYPIYDRVSMEFIASLKDLHKNLIIFAHEKQVEITRESGGVYTQFQPAMRNLDAIMGIIPLVGRLVIVKNQETQESSRVIVLQPTQTTRAKDQLIGDKATIGQMELLPLLNTQ